MKVTRSSVFETNSSSSHSLTICDKGKLSIPTYLDFVCGEFGWEHEKWYDSQSKLSYVLTGVQYAVRSMFPKMPVNENRDASFYKSDAYKNWMEQCDAIVKSNVYISWIKDVLKGLNIEYYPEDIGSDSEYFRFGYIDHQSTDLIYNIFSKDECEFKTNFINFVFNPSSYLETDNDNH